MSLSSSLSATMPGQEGGPSASQAACLFYAAQRCGLYVMPLTSPGLSLRGEKWCVRHVMRELVRWLVLSLDRLQGNQLVMTQGLLDLAFKSFYPSPS